MSAVLEARDPSAPYLESMQSPLVKHFELVASAPGGVARLRELILTLAIQGKLVRQCADDAPAEQHLARVRAAIQERAPHGGGICRGPAVRPIAGEEKALSLPPGWIWCRLGEVALPQAGFAFKSSGFNEAKRGKPLIRIRDVGSGAAPTTYFAGEFRDEFLVEAGEWLISMDGEFRVRRWQGPAALLNQRVTRLIFFSQATNQSFIAASLQRVLSNLQGVKAYTTVDHLSGKQIADAVIALPPEAEQRRIMARLEGLMRVCDGLEEMQRLQADQHKHLVEKLLDTLTASGSTGELAANWQRVAAHFDLLLDRPDAVDALEHAILLLAVRGQLVLPCANDEPASVLLDAIRKEKERRTKNKIGAARTRVIEDGAVPFVVPPHWTWCVLADLAVDGPSNGLSPKPVEGPTAVRCLSLSATTQGYFKPSCFKYVDVSESVAASFLLKNGDLLIQRGNSLDYVGIAALYDGEDDGYIFPDLMMRVVLSSRINPRFVHMWLVCEHGREYFRRNATGTQGTMPKVNQATVSATPIPLPPVAEQDRIVACVDQLRRICSELHDKLAAARNIKARLADALGEGAEQGNV